jgi:Holliday junction resolvase RusA-like endonuclease
MPDTNLENLKQMLATFPNKVTSVAMQFKRLISRIRWTEVSFTIPTIPEPSHRPRLSGYRVYVPGAAKHQSFFNREVLPKLKGLYITTPCIVNVDVFVPTPKSFTKTQQILAEEKLIRPWGNIGDVDNFAKALLDMMQPNERRGHVGIMANDCLVIENTTRKFYSQTPRYEVTIRYMNRVPDVLQKLMKLHD